MELASSFLGSALAVAPREDAGGASVSAKGCRGPRQGVGARCMVAPREGLGSAEDGGRCGGAGPGRVKRHAKGVLLACKHRQRQAGSLSASEGPSREPSALGGESNSGPSHLISLHTPTKRHHASKARRARRVAASTSSTATQAWTADLTADALFPAVPNWNDDILPYGAWVGGTSPGAQLPHPFFATAIRPVAGLRSSTEGGDHRATSLSSHARLAPAGLSPVASLDFWSAGPPTPSGTAGSSRESLPPSERLAQRPEASSGPQGDDTTGAPPAHPRAPERAPARAPPGRPFRAPFPFLAEGRKGGRVEEAQRPEWEAMPPLPHTPLEERAARKEKAQAAASQKQRRRQRVVDAGSGAEQVVARSRGAGRQLEERAGAGAGTRAGEGAGGEGARGREGVREEAGARQGLGVRAPEASGKELQRPPQSVRAHPAIFPISASALRAVVPISGSGTRVLQCLGGPPDWLRRFVLSMGSAVLLYNVSPICTIVAAFYWAWAPIWAAALGNMALRSKYAHAGIWVGRVRKVAPARAADGRRKWEVYVGDASGVLIKMLADPPSLPSPLTPGEPVQMVVLSDGRSFSRFRVLREAFLPRRGLWLSEEAALERPLFESLQAHVVPAVLNKLDPADEEDWDGLFSLLCDETNETLRQYSYDDTGPYASDAEGAPLSIFEGASASVDATCGIPDLGNDIALHALLSESQEEMREQYRDYS